MKIIYLTLLTLLLYSCGPSAEEKAAIQKAREDSIRVATKLQVEKIQSLKDLLTQTESEKEGLTNRLMFLRADLVAAKDKLNTIGEYQLLRTSAQREEQIRNQVVVIETLTLEIEQVSQEIQKSVDSITDLRKQLSALNHE